MKAGFIGLGRMGTGMAGRLLTAGHEVTVYNRTIGKAHALQQAGARVATHVSEACDADVVITMVADDRALRDIAFQSDGLLTRLRPGAIHVSMSTISVELADELTEAHASAGQTFVSALVFGRPEAAEAGKLFILTAGPTQAVSTLEPLFTAMGQQTVPIFAQPRDANLVKITGNFLIFSMTEALSESAALVQKAGIAPETFMNAMTSTVFNVPIYRNYGALIASGKFTPPGFAAPLAYKDVGLALSASESLRVPMPTAHLVRDRLLRLLAGGGEELDVTALAKLSAADAGLTPR